MIIRGQLVDLFQNRVYAAEIEFCKSRIEAVRAIKPEELAEDAPYILPGLVDAHVHVESSMLLPSEFARMASCHGTVSSVSDPHEIANVLGIEGVRYMIRNGEKVPFKFWFGAPSCVPATSFETAGAELSPAEIRTLLVEDDLPYLAEMMNFPGVLHEDPLVMEKIAIARSLGKPVDGHAPGMTGADAKKYAAAGISTDHECFSLEEALFKIDCGMKILIREGSAARNFEALWPLLQSHPQQVMFCSDDKHPNDLEKGHLNQLLSRAVAKGIDPLIAIAAASRNVVEHYGMPVGLLREGDPADLVLVRDLKSFEVLQTWIDGSMVAEAGKALIENVVEETINRFEASPLQPSQLQVPRDGSKLRTIEVFDGELVTGTRWIDLPKTEFIEPDQAQDLAKLVVLNRYRPAPPAIAFVSAFGLKHGALASTVAHDSHNIIAIGMDDASICRAVEALIKCKGGLSLVDGPVTETLPLPVAGLLSTEDAWTVAAKYDRLDKMSRVLGSPLGAPYMTLSFLALLVIPELKLSDLGLFDGGRFAFVGQTKD